MYAACDVLVVPSIRTRTFREPWGLVVNEAMNRGLPVIASDAVGAAAGGLVRDGVNGLVVPAGDSAALAAAIRRLAGDAGAARAARRAGGARTCAPTATTPGRRASAKRSRASASPAGVGSVASLAYENRPLSEPRRRPGADLRAGRCSRASRRRRARDTGTKIIERCTHGQSISGFSQQAYRRALAELPTEVEEYSDCANLIRRAQLAAAAGGGSGSAAAAAQRRCATPLSPSERSALSKVPKTGAGAAAASAARSCTRASCTRTSPRRSARCPTRCWRCSRSCSPARWRSAAARIGKAVRARRAG